MVVRPGVACYSAVTALRHFLLKGGGIVMSEEKLKETEEEKGGSLSEDIKNSCLRSVRFLIASLQLQAHLRFL